MRIIGCTVAVAKTLGSGLVEKVYGNGLALEPRNAAAQQRGGTVAYKSSDSQ